MVPRRRDSFFCDVEGRGSPPILAVSRGRLEVPVMKRCADNCSAQWTPTPRRLSKALWTVQERFERPRIGASTWLARRTCAAGPLSRDYDSRRCSCLSAPSRRRRLRRIMKPRAGQVLPDFVSPRGFGEGSSLDPDQTRASRARGAGGAMRRYARPRVQRLKAVSQRVGVRGRARSPRRSAARGRW